MAFTSLSKDAYASLCYLSQRAMLNRFQKLNRFYEPKRLLGLL